MSPLRGPKPPTRQLTDQEIADQLARHEEKAAAERALDAGKELEAAHWRNVERRREQERKEQGA